MENLTQLFEDILDKFEEKDSAAIMASLSYVNMRFIEFIDSCNLEEPLDESVLTNILEFGEFFYKNYGEDTIDDRILMFNEEEPIILDTYLNAGTELINVQILEYANANMTKKNQYDLKTLKKQLEDIADKYENVFLEKQGKHILNGNVCNISDYYEYVDDNDEMLDRFLTTFLFTDAAIMFIQCDNNTDEGVLYAVVSENNSWKNLEKQCLKDIVDELDENDMNILGYSHIIIDEIEKKF